VEVSAGSADGVGLALSGRAGVDLGVAGIVGKLGVVNVVELPLNLFGTQAVFIPENSIHAILHAQQLGEV